MLTIFLQIQLLMVYWNKVKLPGSGKLVEDMAPGYIAQAGMKLVYHEQWPEEGFSDWLTLANSIKNFPGRNGDRNDGIS
ncbi:MAG: hypothetical protein CM1200mP30_01000 [Pseudomonadota bacterium]|nr:MAG: hypothetical protein CM1200mP30_01000 [Pseudomonadota bacterium]